MICCYRGYGQAGEGPEAFPASEEMPTREDVLSAIAAAEQVAEEAKIARIVADQQIGFNAQLISGFVASAMFGIVAAALGTALTIGKQTVK
jgi:hypothetical protein